MSAEDTGTPPDGRMPAIPILVHMNESATKQLIRRLRNAAKKAKRTGGIYDVTMTTTDQKSNRDINLGFRFWGDPDNTDTVHSQKGNEDD